MDRVEIEIVVVQYFRTHGSIQCGKTDGVGRERRNVPLSGSTPALGRLRVIRAHSLRLLSSLAPFPQMKPPFLVSVKQLSCVRPATSDSFRTVTGAKKWFGCTEGKQGVAARYNGSRSVPRESSAIQTQSNETSIVLQNRRVFHPSSLFLRLRFPHILFLSPTLLKSFRE